MSIWFLIAFGVLMIALVIWGKRVERKDAQDRKILCDALMLYITQAEQMRRNVERAVDEEQKGSK